MSTIPWEQVRAVVDAALELPPAARSPFLDQACPQVTVRRYVESLIFSFDQAGGFLEQPASVKYSGAMGAHAEDSWIGRIVGAYEIEREIGKGGMGSVYLAARADDQYRKQVAVKVVRFGIENGLALARFKSERQILADLDHPNIARLLEGGSTERGEPYFVMEYIQGQQLDQYCDEHNLSVTERLELFRSVCSAVQYAHQKLVIHRDIKPGNILVTSEGVSKLLDFGIAKILDRETGAPAADRTKTMARVLTPDYASPEQWRGENITTASDVYSLGVVLYELLVGRKPYHLKGSPEDLYRAVTESEPERPSAAVSRLQQGAGDTTAERISVTREGTPDKLRRRLSGDIDYIILKALRKEPQRRYVSVEQFSEDIRRHLAGLPVLARRDTFSYRAGKFVRRHAAGVTAACLVVISLTVGLVIAVRQAKIARIERARAERRFNDVRSLAKSLLFDIYNGIRDLPGSTPARQLLVTKALQYLDSLSAEARGDVSLQHELADAYERVGSVQGEPFTANLGDTAGALASYEKARTIRAATASTDGVADQIKYASNCRTVSALQLLSSNTSAALSSGQQAVSIALELLKHYPDNPEVLVELAGDYSNLGTVLEESHADQGALETQRKALEIDQKLAENSKDRVRLRNLAVDEYHIGRHFQNAGYRAEALDAYKKSLSILEPLAQDTNDTVAQRSLAAIIVNSADTLLMNGDPATALSYYRKGLNIVEHIAAADPKNAEARADAAEEYLNIGVSLEKLGKIKEAQTNLLKAMAMLEKGVSADPNWTGGNWDLADDYVWAASVTADPTQAWDYYQKALKIEQRLGKIDSATSDWRESEAEVRVKMGDFLLKTRQFDRAAENYSEAETIAQPIVSAQPDRQEGRYALASAYFGLGQIAARRAEDSQSLQDKSAHWMKAKSRFQQSADAWRQVRHPAAVTPNGFDSMKPEEATRQLARSNTALAQLGKSIE